MSENNTNDAAGQKRKERNEIIHSPCAAAAAVIDIQISSRRRSCASLVRLCLIVYTLWWTLTCCASMCSIRRLSRVLWLCSARSQSSLGPSVCGHCGRISRSTSQQRKTRGDTFRPAAAVERPAAVRLLEIYRFCCCWPLTLYICVRDWWWNNPPRWKVSSPARAHRPLLDEQMRWSRKRTRRRRRRWAKRKEKRAQLMCSHTRTHVIPNGGGIGGSRKGHPSVCWYKKCRGKIQVEWYTQMPGKSIYQREKKTGTSSYPGNAGHRIEKRKGYYWPTNSTI